MLFFERILNNKTGFQKEKGNQPAKGTRFSRFVFHISQIYIYLIASEILIAALLFAAGRGIGWYLLPVSFMAALFLLAQFYDGDINKTIVYEIIASAILLTGFIYFSGRIFDTTWDGNTYHKMAVGLMRYKWNPLRELPGGDVTQRIIGTTEMFDISLYTEAYTKGTEIFGASIYAMTDNIECGKAYTLLSMFCAFGITYHILQSKKKGTFMSLLFAVVVAMNPIAVQQIDSFYVDGFLHLMLYILILSLIQAADKEPVCSAGISGSLVASSMIILSNTKFTGLLYGGIYCIAYYIYGCIKRIRDKQAGWFKRCLKIGLLFACLAGVCIFWAGNSSYLTNIIRHKTIGYPLTGKNGYTFESSISPFPEKNHIKNLLIAIYCRMDNFTYASGQKPILKIPFSIYWNDTEKLYLKSVDCLLSGFGIWFSAAFTIGIISIVIKLVKMKKDKKFWFWLMNLLIIAVICGIISESWYAKYSPHVYFIPLIGLYFILDSNRTYIAKYAGVFVSFVFLFNGLLFLWFVPEEIRQSKVLYNNIISMKQYETVLFDYNSIGAYPGICFNLLDQNVHYQVDLSLNESGVKNRLHPTYPVFARTYWIPK